MAYVADFILYTGIDFLVPHKEIIRLCRSMGKAFIVATNMLESMIVHQHLRELGIRHCNSC